MEPERLADFLRDHAMHGARIFVAGNGGSHANALHLLIDLVSPLAPCSAGWPVHILGGLGPLSSALANDTDFASALAVEFCALGRVGDVVIVITTSGKSANLRVLVDEALRRGAKVVCLTTYDGRGRLGGDQLLEVCVSNGPPADVEAHHAVYISRLTAALRQNHQVTDAGRPAVFLDRDGTLIPDTVEGVQLHPGRLLPGVVEGLRALQERGFLLLLVSNQSAVARGDVSRRQHWETHTVLANTLLSNGIRLDDYSYCFHRRDGACQCRKPKPGAIFTAARRWSVDLQRSILVGNQKSDMAAAAAAGLVGARVQWSGEGWKERMDFASAVCEALSVLSGEGGKAR